MWQFYNPTQSKNLLIPFLRITIEIMKNKSNIKTNPLYLNDSPEFISALKFEADYAIALKGGYIPSYLDEQKRKRLINAVNLINQEETVQLIHSLFIGKN